MENAVQAIDISGRSGSVADVTALQILRGVISGTAGAAVFTPDDASASLPGDVSTGTQTFAGNKTFKNNVVTNSDKSAGAGLIVWGTGATDPVIETDGTSVDIGQNTDSASLSVYGRITSYGDGTAGGVRVSKDYGLTGRYLDLIAGLLPLYTTTNGPYILAKGSTAGPEIALVFNSDLAMGDGGRGVALAGGDSYGIAVAGSFLWGATGTSGGGDTVTGGIIITLGTPGSITNLTYSGSQAATGDISPAQLVANTNDWNPTGW
jgi:hypothetical protein